MDYALNQQNIWSRLTVVMKLKAAEHNESIHYSHHVWSDKTDWEFYLPRERDRNCRLFGPYCQFLLLFSTPLLFLVSLFLLMPLCVVTPRPAIRHRRFLICSYSLGNPICLLIPCTASSPTFSSFPRSLLSPPVLPVVRLGTNNPETAV